MKPNHVSTRRHAAFTLVDLLTVMVVCLLMLAAIGVVQGQLFERQRLVKCAGNLRQIGMAAILYANEQVRTGAFPRTRFDPDTVDKPAAFTKPNAPHPFKEGAPGPNDVTSAFYLLQRTQEITPDVFVCPSSKAKALKFARAATQEEVTEGAKPDAKAADAKAGGGGKADAVSVAHLSNFPGPENVSYGYNNPYPSKDAVLGGWKFNNSLGPDFVIAADAGPAAEAVAGLTPESPKEAIAKGNSPSHRSGQNVVYADGHVAFATTPFCGHKREKDGKRDNIYARYRRDAKEKLAGDAVMGPANDPSDSVVLPPSSLNAAGTTKPAAPPAK